MKINGTILKAGSKDILAIKLVKICENCYKDRCKNTLNGGGVKLIYWILLKCNNMLTVRRKVCQLARIA